MRQLRRRFAEGRVKREHLPTESDAALFPLAAFDCKRGRKKKSHLYTIDYQRRQTPKGRFKCGKRDAGGGGGGGEAVYNLQPNVQTVAPISNLQPSIKAQRSNRGGEPSARRSPDLLCSHVSENKAIRGHTLPVSGMLPQLRADCLNSSSWSGFSAGDGSAVGLSPWMDLSKHMQRGGAVQSWNLRIASKEDCKW